MKAHTLHRLLSSLYSKPLLISKEGFQSISSYLNSRNAELLDIPDDKDIVAEPSMDVNSGIGVITIRGPLTYRTTGWEMLCGGYSYEMLLEQAAQMVDAGVKKIVLDVDSGGGEAYGCFESVDELRKMCDDAGVTLHGYIDGHACSAAYAIICACDDVSINPYGEAGSVGVLICLYNDSKHLEQEGYERVFVTDGTEKVPYAEDGSFRKDFIKDLENKVAQLGDAFRMHVSKYTGMSVEDVKNTNAKVFSAKDALALGLVNKIQTRAEFISDILGTRGH